ncbi:MAG: hypothetical protein ACKE51_02150 [Methylococcaceae bacterium]
MPCLNLRNERVALTIAVIFLDINDYTLNAPEAETVIAFELLASGKFTETQLAFWFQDFT